MISTGPITAAFLQSAKKGKKRKSAELEGDKENEETAAAAAANKPKPRKQRRCNNHSHYLSFFLIADSLLLYTYHPTGSLPSLVTRSNNHSYCPLCSLLL